MQKIRARFYCGLEDVNRDHLGPSVYRAVMNKHFTGYTMFAATGYWESEPEPCVVFEVIRDPYNAVSTVQVAEELREAGNQSAVLVTTEEISADFISKP